MQPTRCKYLLKRFIDSMMTNHSQAPRVDTDDLFVIGPNLHESGQISSFKGIIESELCLFSGGEHDRHRLA